MKNPRMLIVQALYHDICLLYSQKLDRKWPIAYVNIKLEFKPLLIHGSEYECECEWELQAHSILQSQHKEMKETPSQYEELIKACFSFHETTTVIVNCVWGLMMIVLHHRLNYCFPITVLVTFLCLPSSFSQFSSVFNIL